MRAVIFANGVLKNIQDIQDIIVPDDLIIAANGGTTHCQALGIKPSLIIGDLDSGMCFVLGVGFEMIGTPQERVSI